jgi:hypothetical protein
VFDAIQVNESGLTLEFCNVNKVGVCTLEIVKIDDEELYTKCWQKNQNYVISKNWKNLRVNERQ